MPTFTSSLPEDLLKELDSLARQHSVPKNRLIEKALRIYLDQMKRAEYAKSYQRASQDVDIIAVAEEGMADYLKELEEEDLR